MEEGYGRHRRVWYKGVVTDIPITKYQELQSAMFLNIWRERIHNCFVSREGIYAPRTYNFHHILEKRNYELYSLCKWNIVMLNKSVHDMYESKPDTVPVLVELKHTLLIKIEDDEYEFDNDTIWHRHRHSGDLSGIFTGKLIAGHNKEDHKGHQG